MTFPSSVIHDTFTIQRSYLATPQRVFAAFSSNDPWGDAGDFEEAGGIHELDFRVGGHERFGFKHQGNTYRFDGRYYDIVPDQRIVFSYELYSGDARMSVSLATIEFAKHGDGTALAWTEQGAFLDGIEGPGAPAARREGTVTILDQLASYLQRRAPR